jgi:hypothetical protein
MLPVHSEPFLSGTIAAMFILSHRAKLHASPFADNPLAFMAILWILELCNWCVLKAF